MAIIDFALELDEAIKISLDEFKLFISSKIKTNDNYLKQFFSFDQTPPVQMTVLNYLIYKHKDAGVPVDGSEALPSPDDMTPYIDYVFEKSLTYNLGEPLHQVIAKGAIRLACHLLGIKEKEKREYSKSYIMGRFEAVNGEHNGTYDFNRRDRKGRTLISLALETKNLDLLMGIIRNHPEIDAPSIMSRHQGEYQPLQQAIENDFAEGVCLLLMQGANCRYVVGRMKNTPLLLAASLGKSNALRALLDFLPSPLPNENNPLEETSNNLFEDTKKGHTAIEELCERIANNLETDEAIRGVAMLLCCGAEPPAREEMSDLLRSNRAALLKEIDKFLAGKPELVDAFVQRCHLTDSPLHKIVYADNSWSRSMRHLFGRPSDAAITIENLILRKQKGSQPAGEDEREPVNALEPLSINDDPVLLYARFVARYKQTYDNQLIANPWSEMRWMIAEGRCNWAVVHKYALEHPTSRTRLIFSDMFQPLPPLMQGNIADAGEAPVAAASMN